MATETVGDQKFGTVKAAECTVYGSVDLLCQWDTGQPAPATDAMCDWLARYEEEFVADALRKDLTERFSMRSGDDLSIALLWCRR